MLAGDRKEGKKQKGCFKDLFENQLKHYLKERMQRNHSNLAETLTMSRANGDPVGDSEGLPTICPHLLAWSPALSLSCGSCWLPVAPAGLMAAPTGYLYFLQRPSHQISLRLHLFTPSGLCFSVTFSMMPSLAALFKNCKPLPNPHQTPCSLTAFIYRLYHQLTPLSTIIKHQLHYVWNFCLFSLLHLQC